MDDKVGEGAFCYTHFTPLFTGLDYSLFCGYSGQPSFIC